MALLIFIITKYSNTELYSVIIISCQKSEKDKLSIVKYYFNTNNTYQNVCDKFDCPLRSLKRWVQKYKKYKTLKRKTRVCNPYKLTKKQVEFIHTKINKNNNICIKSLHKEMEHIFKGYCPSYTYISSFIKKNEIKKNEIKVNTKNMIPRKNGLFVLSF